MSNSSAFDRYVRNVDLRRLLEELGAPDVEAVVEEIAYFTEEAEDRDRILLGYFGELGVDQIVASIVELLLSPPELAADATILDAGAGSGLLTVRVAEEIHRRLPEASFYGMDVTPAALYSLARKSGDITPFLGIAENIAGSAEHARRRHLEIPVRFDAIFSTLMLHHCPDIRRVLRGFRDALNDRGKAVLIDLCEHPFEEFKEEMGDVNLGFDPSTVERAAGEFFPSVQIRRMPGIRCESSGRSAELFIAYLTIEQAMPRGPELEVKHG